MIERTAVLEDGQWRSILDLPLGEFQHLYDEMGERLEALLDEEGGVEALLSTTEAEEKSG